MTCDWCKKSVNLVKPTETEYYNVPIWIAIVCATGYEELKYVTNVFLCDECYSYKEEIVKNLIGEGIKK
ncbi:MAG: hypothetical protein ACOC80_07515 [Petrotogales bacterium]